MRIVVPAVPGKLHPNVVPALLDDGAPAVEVRAVAGDFGYFELFSELWRDGADFLLVEHDIELHAGVLAGLEACPETWCAHSYPVYWGDVMDTYGVPGLGCTRFRAELIAEHPDLPDEIAGSDLEVTGAGARHWMELDGAVGQWLRGPYRHRPHRHRPNVRHHHHYVYEGVFVPDDIRANLAEGHPLALPRHAS